MPSTLDKPYTTVDDVRAEIRSRDTDITDKLIDSINLASRWIDSYCGTDFWYHNYATTPYAAEVIGKLIVLPWPVITLTKIEYGEKTLIANLVVSSRRIDITAYLAELIEVEEWMLANVYGTFGYALNAGSTTSPPISIPASVRRASTLIASAWSGEYRVEKIGLDGQRVSVAESNIPKDALQLLAPHKKLVV